MIKDRTITTTSRFPFPLTAYSFCVTFAKASTTPTLKLSGLHHYFKVAQCFLISARFLHHQNSRLTKKKLIKMALASGDLKSYDCACAGNEFSTTRFRILSYSKSQEHTTWLIPIITLINIVAMHINNCPKTPAGHQGKCCVPKFLGRFSFDKRTIGQSDETQHSCGHQLVVFN